jgi:O-antigen/teichoic acid export membrane protein
LVSERSPQRLLALIRAASPTAVGNAGLNAAAFALNLIFALLLARFLGVRGYGVYAFAIAWTTLLAVPAVLGLPAVVVRSIATYRVNGSWGLTRGLIRRANQAGLAAAAALCIGFASVAWLTGWPAGRFFWPTLLALPLVPLIVIVSIRQSAMQAFGRTVLGRAPEALVSPVLALVAVIALHLTLEHRFSPVWAIEATLFGAVVAAAAGVVLLRRTIPAAVREALPIYEHRAWLAATLPLLAMGVIQTANAQVGVILVGVLKGSRDAGLFSVANRSATMIGFFLIATIPTLMPTIANLRALDAPEALQTAISRSARLVFLASLPVAIVLFLFPEPILSIFGPEFRPAAPALRILCLGQLVNVSAGFVGTILMMIGQARELIFGVVVGTVINVGLCAGLIPSLGAEGAAIGGAAGLATMNIVLAARLWRRDRIYSPALRVGGLGRLAARLR